VVVGVVVGVFLLVAIVAGAVVMLMRNKAQGQTRDVFENPTYATPDDSEI